MKEKLLIYYRENVRVYSLVFSFMKKEYTLHNYAFYLFMSTFITIPIALFTFNYFKLLSYIFLLMFPLSLILFIFAHRAFNRKAREIVRKKYRINTSRDQWRTPELGSIQSKMITSFLRDHNMYQKWKIELLIEMFNQEKDKSKVPPLIPPSIFIGLTVPNLTQFLMYLYSRDDVKEYTLQVYIFGGILFITLLFIWMMALLMRRYQELKEDVILKEVIIRKNLISILQDVLLTYREDDN